MFELHIPLSCCGRLSISSLGLLQCYDISESHVSVDICRRYNMLAQLGNFQFWTNGVVRQWVAGSIYHPSFSCKTIHITSHAARLDSRVRIWLVLEINMRAKLKKLELVNNENALNPESWAMESSCSVWAWLYNCINDGT